ncbi:exported hypothetical protein [uncultured Paludibacter sp.]|uniref:IPT/TIG domain-containing protein n=1 Tax=uncultured Paludibacter sp. TaxID=497635 RepID=A0A653AK10_9BACT|nr:exported hypothetical protein [uncultured Paludibacter sp.]
MKPFKIIYSIISLMILAAVITGCDETVPLSVKTGEKDAPFTFIPEHGYPGTTVKIKGKDLSNVTKVAFGTKAVMAEDFSAKTDTVITLVVPVGAQTGRIVLEKEAVVLTSATDFTVDDSPKPTILEFTPAIVGSGESVTITGSFLNKVTKVEIGTLAATITEQNDEALTITTPAGLQTGKIKLYYNYMTSYGIEKEDVVISTADLTLKLPTINSIISGGKSIDATDCWLNIDDEVIINGTVLDKVTDVKFGGVAATIVSATSEVLTVKVPAGATKGKISLTVPDGTTESGIEFKVDLPTITSFVPGSGEPNSGTRIFSVQGERLSTVNAVKVGDTDGTIASKTDNVITFTVPGNISGNIILKAKNGDVQTTTPFYFKGTFWVSDWDNTYDPVRLTSLQINTADAGSVTTEAGGPTGNYAKLIGISKAAAGDNRFRAYIRADGNPGEDMFILYTSSPKGVYFSFDMSYNQLPAEVINADGSVDVNIFSFTSGDRNPYGFSKTITIPFTGANQWKSVKVHLNDMVEDTNLQDGVSPSTPTSNFLKPNKQRIMAIMFSKAPTTASPIEFNLDNVKFTIE